MAEILTENPVILLEPENQYDKLLVNLSISAVVAGTVVKAPVSLTVEPYRVLSNGTIDRKGETRSWNTADAYEDALTDPVVAEAATKITEAIQQVVIAKGL